MHLNNSDVEAYDDDLDEEEEPSQQNEEQKRSTREWMNRVEKTSFDGSDNEAYQEDSDDGEVDQMLRDDFSLSDENEETLNEDEEEKRDKAFFGDDDYPTLKSQETMMSMTMQQRDAAEKQTRVKNLQKDIDQLESRIKSRK